MMLPNNSTRQCAYQYEVGMGELFLVFLPNGYLHIFEIENGAFTQIVEQEIVPGMTTCDEAAFVAGIGQAFVATPATKTMYAIDLSHAEDGGHVDVYKTTLPFTPTGMMVSGFSKDATCKMEHEKSGASMVKASMFGLALAMVAVVFAV